MYKRITIITGNLLLAINIFAQTLIPADESSTIKFAIKNLGITVNGTFKGIKGEILFDHSNPNNSFFNLSVDAASVNTGIHARDSHLKKEDYLNVHKFPLITFLSTKVFPSGKEGIFIVNGNISIKDVKKSISFPFTISEQENGFLFKGTFKLNRRDFNVGKASLVLSDNLDVSFSVYATSKTKI